MRPMRRPLVSCALAFAPFWLGPSFDGLPLTSQDSGSNVAETYIYGDCTPPPDGGCAPPAAVQNRTTCERNVVALDVVPSSVRLVRGGGIAAWYERGSVDVATGRTTATIFASTSARAARAVRALRHESQSEPKPMSAPVYPPAVRDELKRVVVAVRGERSVARASRTLGLSRAHVCTRLQVARLLPARALAGAKVPVRSWKELARERQVAFWVQEFGLDEAVERFGLSGPEVRRAVRRVRGLTGEC